MHRARFGPARSCCLLPAALHTESRVGRPRTTSDGRDTGVVDGRDGARTAHTPHARQLAHTAGRRRRSGSAGQPLHSSTGKTSRFAADTRSTLCPTSRPSRPWCNRSPARSSSARQLSVGCSASAAQRRLQVRQTRQAAGSAGRACPAGCTSVSVLAKVSNVRTLSSYTLRATHPSPTYSQSKPHVSCVVVRLSRVRACRHGEGGAKSIRCLQRTLGRSVGRPKPSFRPPACTGARAARRASATEGR